MGLFLEDIKVGQTVDAGSREVTAEDVMQFAALTGDRNPLHVDAAFASTGPYGGLIAHGPLVLSLAIGLMSQSGFVSGTALGLLEIETWRFLAPVRIGDTITVHFTVLEKRTSSKPGRGILRRSVQVHAQDGRAVQEGVTTILVRSRTR